MQQKIVPLECLRGLAALIVVIGHCVAGFAPALLPAIEASDPGFLLGGLAFVMLGGGAAAVAFFFVLSGFVLPLPYLRRGDMNGTIRALLKRWPRLAGPVTLTVIGSWLLYAGGLYLFAEAGAINGSAWMQNGGSAEPLPPFLPSFTGALAQGTFWTFFRGDNFYDTSLWTMRFELTGSIVALGLAPVLAGIRRPAILFCLAGVLFATFQKLDFHLNEFVIGMLLVWWVQKRGLPSIRLPMALGLILAGLLLLGFPGEGPRGPYAFLRPLLPGRTALPYLWDLGAVLLMAAVLGCAALNRGLSGPAARWLGRLSFPIYLLHVPIICSLGAAVFIQASSRMSPTAAAISAGAASIAATFLCAIPVSMFDQWWVARLNTLAARAVSATPATATADVQAR